MQVEENLFIGIIININISYAGFNCNKKQLEDKGSG